MALNAAIEWEVRPTNGAATNGGGFKAGASGTDWTQQNAAQYSVTDAVTDGTSTITSATASFGTDVVGNVLYIQGGTGAITAGWYEITVRNSASSITVDRSTGLTTGTGATLKIGGALNTANIPSSAVSGNKVWIKNEAWNEAVTLLGSIVYEGYDSTRSDSPSGSSRPTLDRASAAGDAVTTASGATLKNLIIKSAAGDGIQAGGTFQSITMFKVRVTGNGGNGMNSNGNRNWTITAWQCEFDNNTSAGISNTSGNNDNQIQAYGCIFRDNGAQGITCSGNSLINQFNNCLIFSNSNTGVTSGSGINVFWGCTINSNTGASSDGVSNLNYAYNCIFSNNGRYGVNSNLDSKNTRFGIDYNCFYNNSTSATNGGGLNTNEVTSDPQFKDAANDDFSIGTNLKARGFPGAFPGGLSTGYMDIGAVQRKEFSPRANLQIGV